MNIEANKPSDIPSSLDTALNQFESRLNKVKELQKKMLFKLDGLAALRAKKIILSITKN